MRKSVKLFSILLALAIVISVFPAVGALADGADAPDATEAPGTTETADGNGFAPKGLRWEDTTLIWETPYPMPTAEDMGLASTETPYLLNYEVILYKTDSDSDPELPFITSYAPSGLEGTITDDTFVRYLTDGGTFYFTVQLVALESHKAVWRGDLAKSEAKTFEKVEKTPLETPVIDVNNTFISTDNYLNMTTWKFETRKSLYVSLAAESECTDYLHVLTWYGTNDDPAAAESNWEKIYSGGQYGLSFSLPTERAEGYKHLAFTIQFACMDGRHTDGPESDKVLLDEIKEITDEWTLEAKPDNIRFDPDGTITWSLNGTIPEKYDEVWWDVTVYDKYSGSYVGSDGGYVRYHGVDEEGNEFTSDAGIDIEQNGTYIALVTINAFENLEDPEPGAPIDTRRSEALSNDLTVNTESVLPAPTGYKLECTYIDLSEGRGFWDPTISWDPTVSEGIDVTYSVSWYIKQGAAWEETFMLLTPPITDIPHISCNSILQDGAELAIRVKSRTSDLSKARSSTYSDYIELSDLTLSLNEAFFNVDASDAVYTGSEITKTIAPSDIFGTSLFGHTLIQGTDYDVAYANNTEVGTATITITGIGKYTGELTYSFNITAAPSGGGSVGGDDDYDDDYDYDDDDYYTPPTPADVTESTTNEDGSVTRTTTHADGSKTETTTTTDGVVGTVERSSSGEIASAQVTISDSAADGIVTAPLEVAASADSASAPEISVSVPDGSVVKVEIPVTGVGPGTVAVKVNPDGTEEVIRDCVDGKNGVIFSMDGDVTVKIVERSSSFTDMSGNSAWASDAAEFVAARELFNGTGGDNFTPEGNMSRGMMVTVLYRLAYEPEAADTGAAFGDVADDQFYSEAVAWAADRNIANGYSADTFGPDDNVTREQMVTMLYRYAKSGGWDVTAVQSSLSGFADSDAVHDYARDAMAWAVGAGIILGDNNGNLSPEGHATRAEAATIMMRFCKNIIFGDLA